VELSTACEQLVQSARPAASPLFQSLNRVGTLRIAVKDSGAGLSPQQLAEIGAEGVQFNANELQAGQGSGLGLFISKGIIEQHGGKLVVTSEGLGKGATFTVILPAFYYSPPATRTGSEESIQSDVSRIGHPAHQAPVGTSSKQPNAVAACKLLLVDDSALNRKMLVRLLTAAGHVCEQAEDGAAAVRKYLEMVEHGEPPDAILMDFEMPVMNGPSATARLRELGCTCLIVGVTGNVLPQDVAHFIAQGADAVLPKPVVLEDFALLLSRREELDRVETDKLEGTQDGMRSKQQPSLPLPTFAHNRRVHVDDGPVSP
jgi:CheY-like chemotaxis protein